MGLGLSLLRAVAAHLNAEGLHGQPSLDQQVDQHVFDEADSDEAGERKDERLLLRLRGRGSPLAPATEQAPLTVSDAT